LTFSGCTSSSLPYVSLLSSILLSLAIPAAVRPNPQAASLEAPLRARVANALDSLGVFYFKEASYDKALESLEEALRYQPDSPMVRRHLAMVHYRLSHFDKVIRILKTLSHEQLDQPTLTALAVASFAVGDYHEAALYYGKLAPLAPQDRILRLTLAAAHHLSGNPGPAEAILTQFPDATLARAQFHTIIGDAHRSRTRVPEAIQAYERALSLSPDLQDVNYWLGVLYGDLHLYHKAVRAFEREVRLNPANADAHYALGTYYLSYGNDLDRAHRYFEEAIRLTPTHLGSYLGLIKIRLSERNGSEALALADEARSQGLQHEELHYLRARALNLLGKRDLAKKELKAFQELRAKRRRGANPSTTAESQRERS
jgi:tetratricopeptide (TPR) repeat protein